MFVAEAYSRRSKINYLKSYGCLPLRVSIRSFLLYICQTCLNTKMIKMHSISATINHIALFVYDLNRSAKFYEEVLQLQRIPEPFKDGLHLWFSIGTRSQLHLIEGAPEFIAQEKNTHICFSVASLEDFMINLEELDVPYGNFEGNSKTPNLRSDGIRQIFFQDPDGYWLEVNNDHG